MSYKGFNSQLLQTCMHVGKANIFVFLLFIFSSPELCSRWVIVIAFCPSSVMRQLLLLSNQWVNWDETSQKASSHDLTRFPSIFWDPCRILVFMATKWKKLQNSSSPKLVGRFSNNLVEMFLGWPSIRFLQAMLIGQKTWPPGGQGYFALYGYSEKFKNLLLRKCQADFQIIL